MVAIDARMFCHPIHTGIGQVTVRPIAPGDADMVLAFVGNLSGTSRYFRFFQPLKSLSPSMLKRLTCIDYRTHIALVAIVVVAGRKSIIGEARNASSTPWGSLPATADTVLSKVDALGQARRGSPAR